MATRRQHIRNTRAYLEASFTPLVSEYPYDTTLKSIRIGDGVTVGGYALTKHWGKSYLVAPSQITSNQNDYNPTDLAIAETLQLNSDAARTITGLAGGSIFRRITLMNTGSFNVTLADASASSTAANRFAFGEDVVIRAGGSVDLQYDATASRWRRASGGQKLATIPEELLLAGIISPSQITSNQNDYAPAGITLAAILRLNTDASRNITGLVDPRSGARKTIINVGSFAIVIKNADAGSAAANRFDIGADLTLAGKQAATFVYDATDSRWKLEAQTAGQAVADAGATAVKLGTSAFSMRTGMINGTIVVTPNSPGANQLTIGVKTLAGADPTPSDPVRVVFQTGSGGYVVRDITAALSLVLSAGSSTGFTSSVAGRLWYPLIDTGSGVILGACNARSANEVMSLSEGLLYSTTAEGGAGNADSAQVIYTASAQTNKYIVLAAYSDWDSGLPTAGNWASSPTRTVLYTPGSPKPGDKTGRRLRSDATGNITGTTQIPLDNTIPQQTEGDQYMSLSVTPTFACNLLKVKAQLQIGNTSSGRMTMALFQDAGANAHAAVNATIAAAGYDINLQIDKTIFVGSASATTFKVRGGMNAAGTTAINGNNSNAYFNGTCNSYLEIEEVMG